MSMSAYRASAILFLLPAVCGCGDPQEPVALPECQALVTMSVDSGTTPVISWTPVCRASVLIVDPNSDYLDYWVLATVGDTNGLQPPIRYGASPYGSRTIQEPLDLQIGTFYRARLLRATADSALPFEVVGATFFTP
jgi:hypothetical protein